MSHETIYIFQLLTLQLSTGGASTLARGIAAVHTDEAARAGRKGRWVIGGANLVSFMPPSRYFLRPFTNPLDFRSLMLQLGERRLEANTKGREINMIDKSIQIAKIHITSIEKEIKMQQSQWRMLPKPRNGYVDIPISLSTISQEHDS